MGCAIAASQAEGINLIELNPEYRGNPIKVHQDTFLPTTLPEDRITRINKWKKAVQRSYGWVVPKKDMIMTGMFYIGYLF